MSGTRIAIVRADPIDPPAPANKTFRPVKGFLIRRRVSRTAGREREISTLVKLQDNFATKDEMRDTNIGGFFASRLV
jgi:hypothetical protein